MNRHLTAVLALSSVFVILTPAARANIVDGVTVSPATANVNQSVTVTVLKSGGSPCIAELNYGDGASETSFSLSDPSNQFSHAYSSPGTYTIEVVADSGFNACINVPQTTQVVINAVGGRPAITRAPDRPAGLKRVPPRIERQPNRGSQLIRLPKIVDHAFVPAEVGGQKVWAAPGVLAQGGRLHLKGHGFGQSGVIFIYGIQSDPVILRDPTWSDTRISGMLPANLGGAPEQRLDVQVQVVNWQTSKWSPPVTYTYERAFDRRRLTMDDPSVRVISCGDDGNANKCNTQSSVDGETCGPVVGCVSHGFPAPPSPLPAIHGYHSNKWAAIGDDSGVDRYEINLSNGWFIQKVDKTIKESSADDDVDIPSIPTGINATSAAINIEWLVTPNDSVRYWIDIEVFGPFGTDPF